RFCELFERFTERCVRTRLLFFPLLQVDLGRLSPWGRILRIRGEMRDAFKRDIEARLRGQVATAEDCALRPLLEALREGELTIDDLLDEVTSMLFGGHETTGNVMAWILYELLRDRDLLERVVAEVDAVTEGAPV